MVGAVVPEDDAFRAVKGVRAGLQLATAAQLAAVYTPGAAYQRVIVAQQRPVVLQQRFHDASRLGQTLLHHQIVRADSLGLVRQQRRRRIGKRDGGLRVRCRFGEAQQPDVPLCPLGEQFGLCRRIAGAARDVQRFIQPLTCLSVIGQMPVGPREFGQQERPQRGVVAVERLERGQRERGRLGRLALQIEQGRQRRLTAGGVRSLPCRAVASRARAVARG